MCYIRDQYRPVALQQVLEVPLDALLADFRKELKSLLKTASTDFKSGEGRHTCRAQRIYSSFSLPNLEVLPEEAQRDSARRFEQFGIGPMQIEGKSVLDLGSNVGGILFALQPFAPSHCLGIEYDAEKVASAQKVAAYNGLHNVEYRQGDIDHLQVGSVGGPFDVVLCLAVEKHIQDQTRLFRFLGEVTSETLFFEGNSTTNPEQVRSNLSSAGFRRINLLGMSDDDCIPDNNIRPLLVAWK
jgi:SAM-dependent methyltransferase